MADVPEATETRELDITLIRDEPASQDTLKSHGPLADVIATTIKEQAAIKVIGLLGRWGSGKSTVVRLVQEQLEGNESPQKTYCFTFDAWLHQSDNPRRAFLETLLQFLINKGLTHRADWIDELDQLSGRREETETTTTPVLTWQGRFLAGSTLLLPVGLSLVGYDTIAAAYGDPKSSIALLAFRIGLFICALPALVALASYFWWRPKIAPWKWSFWSKSRGNHKGLLDLFHNRSVEKTHSKVLISPTPTTSEFQTTFRKLSEKVSASSKRLVITIDNLDRLPAEEAVELWVTIRSLFLGDQGLHSDGSGDIPTIILPIDETAIERMYKGADDDDRRLLVQSFMEKSFDVTFSVSRPVMSAWASYLDQRMRRAFGSEISSEWLYITERFFSEHLEVSKIEVTPRHINSVVNRIATLALMWLHRDVPFPCIAYFAIFQDAIEKDVQGELASPREGIANVVPEWQSFVAAIHYGTDPQTALQIIIGPQVRHAISTRASDDFNELSAIPGFTRIVHSLIDDAAINIGTGNELDFMLNAAFLLHTSRTAPDEWVSNTWRAILSSLPRHHQWKSITAQTTSSVEALVAHCEDSELPDLLDLLVRRLESVPATNFTRLEGIDSFFGIFSIIQRERARLGQPAAELTVPGGADEYLAALLRANTDQLRQTLKTDSSEDELVHTLASYLDNEIQSASIEPRLRAFLSIKPKPDWTELIERARSALQTQNGAHFSISPAAGALLLLMATSEGAAAAVRQLGPEGHLAARFSEAAANDLPKTEAKLISLLMQASVDFGPPNGQSWEQYIKSRPELVESINMQVGLGYGTDRLVKNASDYPSTSGLMAALFTRRARARNLGSLHLKTILDNLDSYTSLLPSDARDPFLIRLAAYQTFWEKLEQAPFEAAVFTVVRALGSSQSSERAKAATRLKAGLSSFPTERWTAALRSGGDPLDLALEYGARRRIVLGAGEFLSAALIDLIPEILSSSDGALRQRWFAASDLLSKPKRRIVIGRLRDQVLNGAVTWNLTHLLESGDGALVKEGAFERRADDAVRNVVFPLLTDPVGLQWLSTNSKLTRGWLDESDASSRKAVNERLAEVASGTDADLASHAARLRGALK